ncbi:MAG: YdcF family protein [Chitinispirillaceae bacterium]|nr:YdcF family protein [Chitinispirillaceae bacterium]
MVLILKIIACFFYPLGFCLTLSIVGVFFLGIDKRVGRSFIIFAMGLLYLFSTPLISSLIVRPLEAPYFVQKELPKDCSAIVVLGGSGMPMIPPRKYPEINDAGDRLIHAARLYKAGLCPRIITTGGFIVGALHQTITEGEHNAMLLKEFGVDSAAIIVERRSRVTADHGREIAKILDSLQVPKKVIIVTSAAHMNRSLPVFKKWGFEVFPSATDFSCSKYFFGGIWDIFPSSYALHITTSALHEYYGMLGYKLLGRI